MTTTDRIAAALLTTSFLGLIGIAVSEGYRDTGYLDSVGVPTEGFGSTKGAVVGKKTTVERALVRLGDDISEHERGLKGCLKDVPLYQAEWDSFMSWTFNVGVQAACGSTLVKKLKAGDYRGACDELLRWDKAGGRSLPGLTKRRQQEHAQCIGAGK